MQGAAGCKAAGNGIPLASRSKLVEDAISNGLQVSNRRSSALWGGAATFGKLKRHALPELVRHSIFGEAVVFHTFCFSSNSETKGKFSRHSVNQAS